MTIRNYQREDCAETAALFSHTVHTVNARDYSKAQLDAWAAGADDLEKWNQRFETHYSVVAVEDGEIVGFGDIDGDGYLDRLFVHAARQRQGIASAICDTLESAARGRIETHASITAKPFFESRGYHVVREQRFELRGVMISNFVMEKPGN